MARFEEAFRVFPGARGARHAARGARARRDRDPGRSSARSCSRSARWVCGAPSRSSSTAERTAASKPDPAPYAMGVAELTRAGHTGRIVAIEDALGGVRSAKGAGSAASAWRMRIRQTRCSRRAPMRWSPESPIAGRTRCWRGLSEPAPRRPRRSRSRRSWRSRPPGSHAWKDAEVGGVRGMTIGPIENGYHPGVGYGSPAYDRTLDRGAGDRARTGSPSPRSAAWQDLAGTGRRSHLRGALRRAAAPTSCARSRWPTRAACASCSCRTCGPSPESGARSSIRRPTRAGRAGRAATGASCSRGPAWRRRPAPRCSRWASSCARGSRRPRAPSFARLVTQVRPRVPRAAHVFGQLGRRRRTVVLGDLDVIGINAFYPLADQPGASETRASRGRPRACATRCTRSPRRGASRCSSPRSATRRDPIPPCDPGSGPTR